MSSVDASFMTATRYQQSLSIGNPARWPPCGCEPVARCRRAAHRVRCFANAARVAPDAVAATLDDDALTFGEIDAAGEPHRERAARPGVGRGDRVLWWGDTSLEAVPVFAALAKIGAVFAPLNARGVRRRGRARRRVRAARAAAVRRVARRSRRGARERGRHPVHRRDRRSAPRRRRSRRELDERDPHVIFFTSGSTGRPKGVVLSHRTNWLRTYVGATTTAGRRAAPCACSRCSTWRAGRSRSGAWQGRRPVHFVRIPDAADAAAHHRTPPRRAALLHPRGVGPRARARRRRGTTSSTLVEADTGTSATPPELLRAIKDALPHTATRVFYGSTEAGPGVQLADADLFRKPGAVGVAASRRRREARPTTGEVCMRSPFLMDGYFDDARRDRRRARRRLVPHRRSRRARRRGLPVDRRPGARRHPHRRRDGRADRGRAGRRRASRRRRSRGRRRARCRSGARWSPRSSSCAPAASAPTSTTLREFCAGRLAPFKHPRRVAVVDALPRTAATGQIQRTLIVERLQAGG